MRFKEGALGVVVVMVSVALALVGSWALSTDVNDVTVTGYDYVAEITGLFDADQAPEYIEYSPSTNYIGYYTDPTVIVDKRPAFSGVDYVESSRANQYRLNPTPTSYANGSIDLTDYSGTYPFDDPDFQITFAYIDENNGYERLRSNTTGTTVTLTSYITDMGLDSSVNRLIIKSNTGLIPSDYEYGQLADVDWILLTIKDQWRNAGSYYSCVVGTEEWMVNRGYSMGATAPNGVKVYAPFLSCIVDLSSGHTTLFSDNDCQNSIGIFVTDDVILSFGGTGTAATNINFDSTAFYDAQNIATKYMDPSKGVEVA